MQAPYIPRTKSQVPFPLLRSYRSISPGPRHLFMFRNKAGGPYLVGCRRLPIQYIRSYPPHWRPLLHPQREGAPWRGDRDPLIIFLGRNLRFHQSFKEVYDTKDVTNVTSKVSVYITEILLHAFAQNIFIMHDYLNEWITSWNQTPSFTRASYTRIASYVSILSEHVRPISQHHDHRSTAMNHGKTRHSILVAFWEIFNHSQRPGICQTGCLTITFWTRLPLYQSSFNITITLFTTLLYFMTSFLCNRRKSKQRTLNVLSVQVIL
jgi:hypothetical protein